MATRFNPVTQQVEQVYEGGASGGVPPLGPVGGPVVRNFPDGTVRTLRTGGDATNPNDWVIIGQATQGQSVDNSPNVDGAGVQFTYRGGIPVRAVTDPTTNAVRLEPYSPVPVRQRDPNQPSVSYSYSSSTSSQDPAQFAARMEFEAAQAGLDRTFRAGESAADRAQRLALQLDQQGFTREQNAADRNFRAGESAADRTFRAGESATDRAIRAAEFAATYGLNKAQFEAQQNQAESAAARERTKLGLDAAKQYADLINTVDPNAFDAFLKSGGGVIGNSIASGSALSDRAALPSARTKMAMDGIRQQEVAAEQAGRPDPLNPYGYSQQQMSEFRRVNPNWDAQNAAGLGMSRAANMATPVAASGTQAVTDPMAELRAAGNKNLENAKVPSWVPRFAFGTGMAEDKFITGDSTDPEDPGAGGAKPELVDINDPEGNATATVTPLERPGTGSKLSTLLTSIAAMIDEESDDKGEKEPMDGMQRPSGGVMPPRFAFGTNTVDSTQEVTAADRPYINDVLDFRRNAIVPDYNPFDVQFRNVNPFSRASFFAGRQTKYGIPVAAQEFEAQRFAVPGQSRGITSAQGY